MKLILLFLGAVMFAAAQGQTLKWVQSIPLPAVEGRIDHLVIDAEGRRLFVAALGNDTVEVIDLQLGKVTRSLRGFSEPQGILFLPELHRLYVANGGDGAVRVFDATSFEAVTTVKFDGDADNIRYDAAAKQVYVGYGSGALGVIDATRNTVVGAIPLSAHPESFQLEKNGSRAFVNLPRSHMIAVIDRAAGKVTGHWSLGMVAANFPLALDEANHRAFVACRMPARLVVFDTEAGREVANVDLHGDCDDVFYDAARRQIYASCGEGFIDVFMCSGGDHYTRREAVKTSAKARTCIYAGDQLYLAVPREGGVSARIDVYTLR